MKGIFFIIKKLLYWLFVIILMNNLKAQSQVNNDPYMLGSLDSIDFNIEYKLSNYELVIKIFNGSKSILVFDTMAVYENMVFNSNFSKTSFIYSNSPDWFVDNLELKSFKLISLKSGDSLIYSSKYSDFAKIQESTELPKLIFAYSFFKFLPNQVGIKFNLTDINYGEWVKMKKSYIYLERNF